ncbi:MAG TPA: PilZ domain-containing protein [Rectinemataceae bacterium]|nr:PilZ domain-containing protein [Rectinemataceae bacterium]
MTPILQIGNPSTFWSQGGGSDSNANWWIWVIAIVLILAIVIAVGRSARGAPRPKSNFSKRDWRRGARSFGLAEEELRFLETFARNAGIGNPDATLRNKTKLETFFKDVYRSIEKNSESESDAEDKKAMLFQIRERLARQAAQGTPVHSTRQLGRNVPISFITPNEENYPTVIVRSDQQGLFVEAVVDPLGKPIRFHRGAKLSCFFYTKAHQGYQFVTKVGGFQTTGDRTLMVLAHSDNVTALPSRQHQRRSTRVPCVYYHVAVAAKVGKGKNETSARVENISFPGMVTDLSAGGVAIQAATTFPPGDFLKVVLDPGSGNQSAFGKVIRLNNLRGSGGIMHIQFVKLSRKSLNAILSYVHGYTD